MGTIEQDLAAIRTAVYGKDVREAIADGIENCYNETSQSGYSQLNTRVTALEGDALDEKGRLDTVIDNVLELGGRTTNAENDIDSLTEDLNTVNVDISSLTSRVTNAETDISSIYGMTEATRNKLYITNHTTHGDSYSVNGVTVYINDDGSFSFNGTVVTSDAIIGLMGCTSKTDYKISVGSTYTFGRKSVIDAGGSSNPSINLRYDYSSAQNNTITSGVPVSFTNAASVYLRLARGNTYTRATRYFIWAEEGESIHEFVPYGSTAVDIVSREIINGTNELIDELKNDVIEKSHNLFYITANPSPMSNFASARNGLYYRVNSDSSVTIYGIASATTRLPLMGCSTTTDYSVTGQRYLCLSRELIGGTYSGDIPIKYAANGGEIATFPLSTPVYISDTAVLYLQIASGANFGTSSSPATIRWQFTEGNRVEDVYEPYNINVAKDIYARGKLFGIVRYNEAQEITDNQKLQARSNIGVPTISVSGTALVIHHDDPDDYYNRWIWKLSDGEFEVMKNSFGYDATNNVIRIHTSSASTIRRSIVTERGIVPFKVGNTDDDSTYFPIPVPSSATGVSMQITPSTLQTACHISRYTQDGKYEQLYDTGWTSSRSFEFTSGDNLVFTMGLRVDSNNSNFSDSTEPTEIVIQFES